MFFFLGGTQGVFHADYVVTWGGGNLITFILPIHCMDISTSAFTGFFICYLMKYVSILITCIKYVSILITVYLGTGTTSEKAWPAVCTYWGPGGWSTSSYQCSCFNCGCGPDGKSPDVYCKGSHLVVMCSVRVVT